jgi:rod shape-determining protein MreD
VKNKNSFIGLLIILFVIILQSTILSDISIKGIKPDIVLILIILFSNYSGSFTGQTTGFTTGMVEDFLSLSPMVLMH